MPSNVPLFSLRRRGTGRGPGPTAGPPRSRGQALVEFTFVLPIFLVAMLGIIEFGFVFNALLTVDQASQNAALVAAEIGSKLGTTGNLSVADCAILKEVERDVSAPAITSQIQTVDIVWTDANGNSKGSGVTTTTTYTRNGTSNCIFPDGSSGTVPYSAPSPNNYPASNRCNYRVPSATKPNCQIIGGNTHTGGPDFIAVRITYIHPFKTPLRNFVPTTGNNLTFTRMNAMRMEPIE